MPVLVGSIKVLTARRRLGAGVISACIVLSSIGLLAPLLHPVAVFLGITEWIATLVDKVKWIGSSERWARDHPGALADWIVWLTSSIRTAFAHTPSIFIGATFCLRNRKKIWRASTFVYDLALIPVDDALMRPIRRPKAFDPLRGSAGEKMVPLRWAPLPASGPRRDAWNRLLWFAHDGSRKQQGRDKVPFRYVVILGPSGSGKSRLALEFCRMLAKRDFWGIAKPGVRLWLKEFGIRLRATLPWRWHADDPWDAGWLMPPVGPVQEDPLADGSPVSAQVHAGVVSELFVCKLKAWRPRRPTVILLDDPRVGEARRVIEALQESCEHYRHPVRLIVVHPTLLDDFAMVADEARGAVSLLGASQSAPIILKAVNAFREPDIRVNADARFDAAVNPLRDERTQIPLFLEATGGNAFLAEIFFSIISERIAAKQPPSVDSFHVSRDLRQRAERLARTAKAVGVTTTSIDGLTAATLAGGGFRPHLVAILGEDGVPTEDVLAKLFPEMSERERNFVPPVAPRLFGQAFVHLLIQQASDKRVGSRRTRQEEIVAAAWVANPEGTLANAQAWGRDEGALATLLQLNPVRDLGLARENVGLDWGRVVRAYVNLVIAVSRQVWNARRPAATSEGDVERVLPLIASLTPEDAAAGLLPLVLGVPMPGGPWIVRMDRVRLVLDAWISRAFAHRAGWRDEAGRDELAVLTERVVLLQRRWEGDAKMFEYPPMLRRLWMSVIEDAADRPRLGVASLNDEIHSWGKIVRSTRDDSETCRAAFDRMQTLPRENDGDPRLVAAITDLAYATRYTDEVTFRRCFDDVESFYCALPPAEYLCKARYECYCYALEGAIGRRFHGDILQNVVLTLKQAAAETSVANADVAFEVAHGLRVLICSVRIFRQNYNNDQIVLQEYLELFEKVVEPFRGQERFVAERAMALVNVAEAADNVATCRLRLNAMEGDLPPAMENDPRIAACRIAALAAMTAALQEEPDECRLAIKDIERLVPRHGGEAEFEMFRIQSWGKLARACRYDPQRCRECVEEVERLSNPAFHGLQTFDYLRCDAWRVLAWAFKVSNADDCRRAVDQVESISARAEYLDKRPMALSRTRAWSSLAHARRADQRACEAISMHLASIIERFQGDFEFEIEFAWALVDLGSAHDDGSSSQDLAFSRAFSLLMKMGSYAPAEDALSKLRQFPRWQEWEKRKATQWPFGPTMQYIRVSM